MYIKASPLQMYSSACWEIPFLKATHIYAAVHTRSMPTAAAYKLILFSCESLTWQMQFVDIWAVGCVRMIWGLCLCCKILSTRPVLQQLFAALYTERSSRPTGVEAHEVCVQLRKHNLKANEAIPHKGCLFQYQFEYLFWSLCLWCCCCLLNHSSFCSLHRREERGLEIPSVSPWTFWAH